MKLADIVEQLQRVLPSKTSLFHDTVAIASIVATTTAATITTAAAHGLVSGAIVTLSGVETRTAITASATDGLLTRFTTATDHDLTENNPDTETVTLIGFSNASWNAAHELVAVPNRRSFVVRNALGAPTLNGNEVLLEPNRLDGLNGLYEVAVSSRTSFAISGSFVAGTYTPVNGIVASQPRIAAAVSIERAQQTYDQDPKRFWAFVVPEQATVSKDRASESDAISARMDGDTMRLRLLDNFGVLVFAPVDNELAAEESVDICRHDLLGPIVSSLYGTKPLSGLACAMSQFRIGFTGHGVLGYDKARLIYEYGFQAPVDLTSDDAVVLEADRAYRDTDISVGDFHADLTVRADHDEEPL